MKRLNQNGFTLIEIMVVIAMISIMLLAAGYYLGNRGERAQLKSAARDLLSNMTLARTSAIRDTAPWSLSFDPAGNSYRVLDSNGNPFRSVTLPERVTFGSNHGMVPGSSTPVGDGVTFSGDQITYNPDGTCSGTGTAYLTVASGATFAVNSISASGAAKIQSNYDGPWSN